MVYIRICWTYMDYFYFLGFLYRNTLSGHDPASSVTYTYYDIAGLSSTTDWLQLTLSFLWSTKVWRPIPNSTSSTHLLSHRSSPSTLSSSHWSPIHKPLKPMVVFYIILVLTVQLKIWVWYIVPPDSPMGCILSGIIKSCISIFIWREVCYANIKFTLSVMNLINTYNLLSFTWKFMEFHDFILLHNVFNFQQNQVWYHGKGKLKVFIWWWAILRTQHCWC